jgi:hypothetical protein
VRWFQGTRVAGSLALGAARIVCSLASRFSRRDRRGLASRLFPREIEHDLFGKPLQTYGATRLRVWIMFYQ